MSRLLAGPWTATRGSGFWSVPAPTCAPVAVAAYRRMVERQLAAGASRVRLAGEVDFGQDPATWSGTRYEPVVDVALAPYPGQLSAVVDTGLV